ncbi:MAG: hypothetical protein IPI26_05785 [Elusimicrobia bacterium]|nr:hypothetical protein [Elusimicrobiota bacterium]
MVVSLAVAGTRPLAAPSADLRAPDPRRDRSTILRVVRADAAPEIVLSQGLSRSGQGPEPRPPMEKTSNATV